MLANITEALRQGDLAAALKASQAAVADQPDNAFAHHLLGVSLQRTGQLDAARGAFESAIALSPDRAGFHFSLASLNLTQGRSDEARQGLTQALALDPNLLGAYVTLVHLALGRGDRAEAERNLRLAQRVDAQHPQVRVAEGYLAQAAGDEDGAMRAFTSAAAADPSLAAAQLALGMAFLERKMWPFAEQALANSMALDGSRTPNTLRALAEARRRQGKAEQTLATLDELIEREPADLAARGLRAEILSATGKEALALPDHLALLEAHPGHLPSLGSAAALLLAEGRADEALVLVEKALELAPGNDLVWQLRLNLSGLLREDAKDVLDRWQEGNPDSLTCTQMLAQYHHARGESPQAELYADRALAIEPGLISCNLIKLHVEMAQDPAVALARAERLLVDATDPASVRDLNGWAGMALDALGRHDEAAHYWRAMLKQVMPGALPPPSLIGAEQAPAGQIDGTLVWSPVGVRSEFILRQLKARLGPRMRLDRIDSRDGGDGFGLVRFRPDHAEAGTAARWTQSLRSSQLDPATAVDWLPHLDGYTLAALGGARVIALVTDPRDAFINWMIHGSLQNYLLSPELDQAADWLAGSLEALADHRDAHPELVVLACLDRDAGEASAQIEQALSLTEPLPAVFGAGARFPEGHWRAYREAFAAEFARLTPVAVRLGYPLS